MYDVTEMWDQKQGMAKMLGHTLVKQSMIFQTRILVSCVGTSFPNNREFW